MKIVNRRLFNACLFGMTSLGMVAPTLSRDKKIVQIVVPFGAGGLADSFARALFGYCNNYSQFIYVVMNKPGATGQIAAASIVDAQKAQPQLMLAATSTFLSPLMRQHPPRVGELFSKVIHGALLATQASYLVSSSFRADTPWIVELKNRRVPMVMGSLGMGSVGHLLGVLLSKRLGIEALHVPYNSSPAIVQGLISGDLTLSFMAYENFRAHIETNRIQPLMVSATERSLSLPRMPTGRELGFDDISRGSWFSLAYASGADESVVSEVLLDIEKAYQDPVLIASLQAMGVNPSMFKGARQQAFMQAEKAFWSPLLSDAGL